VGLRDLFLRAHEIDGISVAVPPAASGLWRILYLIAYRVTGLDDRRLSADEWLDRRYELLDKGRGFDPGRVDRYFAEDRFDLFHPQRPWLQDPRLRSECPKSSGANKLVFARPSGSNQVWFGHFEDTHPKELPAAEAALNLIAQLFYGASGRCSSRTVGKMSKADTKAGPLRRVVSYHPVGRTLYESLLCGLVPPDGGRDARDDLAPWEDPVPPDPLGIPRQPSWPAGSLVGQSRHAAFLVPDEARDVVRDSYLTWAWRGDGAEDIDPYLITNFNKDGQPYPAPADGSRALWRDLDALLGESSATRNIRRPSVFDSLGEGQLPSSLAARVRVVAYGFDQDGQAKDFQWFTAASPPVLRFLREHDPAGLARIAALHEAAESAGALLKKVLEDAWVEGSAPPSSSSRRERRRTGPWPRAASAYYWSHAEREFWAWYDREDPPRARSLFAGVAQRAIDHAVGRSERQWRFARSVAVARRRIESWRSGPGPTQGPMETTGSGA
jgi:CRISPR system Cascade subunit CasA